jgi:hypothetical protein
MRPKILLVGIDPNAIDYSSGPLAGFNAAGVMQVLEGAAAMFAPRGLDAEMCLIDFGETAEQVLTERLSSARYDCVVIGAGVREPEETLVLFEKVVNAVHRLAPEAAIAFNSNPADSVDAALRWLPKD